MDLDALAKLGEFVGGFFVVVSLVYLAHEVRQNTRSLRTENYARVLDRMSTLQSRLAADAELNHLLTVGAEHPETLKPADRLRFSWALYELFGAAEFMYHQAQQNALPSEVWDRWDASVTWWLSHPGMRAWWRSRPVPLSADFEVYGEGVLATRQVSPEVIERWHRFVAGETLPGPIAGAGSDPEEGPTARSA